MNDITLQIDGMSCGHCVGQVRNALARLEGVRVRHVKVGEAAVTYDAETVAVEDLIGAIAKAGMNETELIWKTAYSAAISVVPSPTTTPPKRSGATPPS